METTKESATGTGHFASTKRLILWKLENTIDSLSSSSTGFVTNQISCDSTQTLCTVVEAIFIHGIRDAFFLKGSRHSNKPSPNFWPFVSKYTHRSIKTQISALNQIHTEIGRARAWVRIVLNEHTLDHHISLFVKDTKQMNQFYVEGAFLRDPECVSTLCAHLKRLNGLRITAPTNSGILNTWTPSPLSLAGIITSTMSPIEPSSYQSIAVPIDVSSPSTSSFGGLSSTGNNNGFKICSSTPSVSSSVLLPDEVAIASGEQQIVAEFGMNADQLLLEEGEQCDEKQHIEFADEQQQRFINPTTASLGMADDLESVYSHPSMLEYHQHNHCDHPFDHYSHNQHSQKRTNVHNNLFSTTYQQVNNKWMMAAMPAEELSNEVIVHRKAAQRHRRRTVSKSSGGDSDNGSSSRCHSTANLCAFDESSLEDKWGNLSTAMNANDDGKPMSGDSSTGGIEQAPVFDEETPALTALRDSFAFDIQQKQQASFDASSPLLGTSLQDELLLAVVVTAKDNDDEFETEELARKKFSLTDERQQPIGDDLLLTNSNIVHPSGKMSLPHSTDSINKMHEFNTTDGLPATFDEALRDFLDKEAQKRRTSRERTSSNVRFYSECSSSSAALSMTDQQLPHQQSPSSNLLAMSPSPPTVGAYARGGCSVSKRGSAATMTAFLFRYKELPLIPFKSEQMVDARKRVDFEEELVAVPVLSSVMNNSNPCSHCKKRVVNIYDGTIPSSFVYYNHVDDQHYQLPRRLCRLTQISRESSLDAQQFRCASCRRNIGASFGPFNVCALNGRCYCVGHCIRANGASSSSSSTNDDGGLSLIPARVVLNGDFRSRLISRESRALLRSVVDKPFMRLDLLNPQIYAHCAMLRKIRDLRLKFSLLVLYLFSCKNSIAEDAKRRIWPHKHWHEDIHLYSIADFEGVANGSLERRLNSLIMFAHCHVHGCQICLQKGFFCELCNASDQQPIYPFQTEITFRCPKCASVFHKECAQKAGLDECTCAMVHTEQNEREKCPKCLRRAKYATAASTPC